MKANTDIQQLTLLYAIVSERISKVNKSKQVAGIFACVTVMSIWSAMNYRIGYFTEKNSMGVLQPVGDYVGSLRFSVIQKNQYKVQQTY